MPLLQKTHMWRLQLLQSLEFAPQLFPIQNTTSHPEIHTKPQWLSKPSASTAQTSTIASTHDRTFFTTRKYPWFKQKTWMLWATNSVPLDKTALLQCSALKATTWKMPSY